MIKEKKEQIIIEIELQTYELDIISQGGIISRNAHIHIGKKNNMSSQVIYDGMVKEVISDLDHYNDKKETF